MNLSSRITQDIDQASQTLKTGGIVGIPTETVYGLAAVALNEQAVSRVFSAKGRPTSHPLIIHLSPNDDINRWGELNESAQLLASTFWPGPITLLVPRTRLVPDWVTGGRDTVALRIPAHDMTIALLDGGHCAIGIESTIVECTSSSVQILRPGKVSALDIANVTGLNISLTDGPSRAPGMLLAHYAPHARVELFDSFSEAQDHLNQYISDGQSVEILHYDDPTTYALSLYDDLRAADLRSREIVLAVMPLDNGLGTAIRDRLAKAAAAG